MRMEKFTNGAAIGAGSTTALFGAFSLNEWAIVIGIICTLGTFGVNWYYRWREYQLKRSAGVINGKPEG